MKKKNLIGIIFLLCIFLMHGCTEKDTALKVSEDLNTIHIYAKYDHNSEEIKYWDSSENLFYYFLPSGVSPKNLTVRTQNGITLRANTEGEDSRILYKSGDSLQNIGLNQIYLLGCYDQNRYLYEVPVMFIKSANVNSMHIHTDTGNIFPLLENKNQRAGGYILMADHQGHVTYRGELEHMKGRGNGSWFSFKKPFNIKLLKEADLLGSGMSKKYSLLSQEQDPTAIRNKLGFQIAEAVGLPATPGSQFTDLWIDGNYQGLYLLTDRIQVGETCVDIPDLEQEMQKVNSMRLKDYPMQETPGMRYSEIPNDPEDITGGYLLEVDLFYPMDKTAWFNTHKVKSVTLKSPSYASRNQIDYLHKLFQNMESTLDADHKTEAYKKFIDEDSWAKMGVLQEIFVNSDFMGSSQYFYKGRDINGVCSPLYAAPIWDMDQTLGPSTRSYFPPNSLIMPTHRWYLDLVQNPYFAEALVKTYRNDFRPIIDQLLNHGIEDLSNELEQALTMNYIRWKSVAVSNFGSEQPFHEATKNLKQFLSKRIFLLDDYLEHPDSYHYLTYSIDYTYKPSLAPYYPKMIVKDGTVPEAPLTPSGRHAKFVQWRKVNPDFSLGMPFDFNSPVTEDALIFAEYRLLTPEEIQAQSSAQTS